MRKEDIEQYNVHFPLWAGLTPGVKKICLLSGDAEQEAILKRVFPKAQVKNVSREQWDLNQPCTEKYDLIVAMNVFMYSPDPALWFGNVLARCRHVWIQDLVCGQRGSTGELGSGPDGDGDSMRYTVKPVLKARYEYAYDITVHQDRLLRLAAYKLDVPDHLPYGLSYIAFMKGDLK